MGESVTFDRGMPKDKIVLSILGPTNGARNVRLAVPA